MKLHASPQGSAARQSLAARAMGIFGSPIDSCIGLLQQQRHPVISFAMGCPAVEALPKEALSQITEQLLNDDGTGALSYGPTEGERTLRDALLEFIPETLGQTVAPDQLLVTAGGTQGLDLACKLLIDPGDLIVVEEPLYPSGAGVIRSYEGQLLPVPIDCEGMKVEMIPELIQSLGRVPKLINVIPNFQNPTGTTLSLRRRRHLLEIASHYGCYILEDDPYGLLDFGEQCPPSLRFLSDNDPRVISVHTFSKIIAPGLRVGWVLAAPALISRMIDAKQTMDTCTNVLGQRIVAEFCRVSLVGHLRYLRQLYSDRQGVMVDALRETFAGVNDISWNEPRGGFFLWLTLPHHVDSQRIFPLALERGVAFVPGKAFSNADGFRNAARICFASPSIHEIRPGIERFRDAIAASENVVC